MPRSGTFLEASISYYSRLGFDALAAMRSTQEELRTGTFEISKTISTVASLWLDAAEGWWSALLVTASEPLPTVFLRLTPLGSTDTREVRVLVPADPSFTGLMRIGDGKKMSGVTIRPLKARDGFEVKLRGLRDSDEPGLYLGLVHMGDKPLATVMVSVERRSPFGASAEGIPTPPVKPNRRAATKK